MDATVAFCVRQVEEPALEVRVNIGVFAGRFRKQPDGQLLT